MLLAHLACAPSQPTVPNLHSTREFQNGSTFEMMRDFDMDSIRDSKVKEFMVLIFKENFAPTEWKDIFEKTDQFSKNRNKAEPDPDVSADFIDFITDKASFLLQWSAKSDQCSVSKNLILRCGNTDQPEAIEPLQWIKPSLTDSVKVPYLKFSLVKNAEYKIEIKLRLEEPASESNQWVAVFSGDAIPESGSTFQNPRGEQAITYYPVGVAQLRLKIK